MQLLPIKSFWPQSIGSRLLVVVNSLLAITLCGLLMWQYEYQMEQAVREKRSSLTDEAIALHAAVAHLSIAHEASSIQRYIDTVCQQMRNAWSPHHHISIRFGDTQLSDTETHFGKCAQLAGVDLRRQTFTAGGTRSTRHISGDHVTDDLSVVVSETVENIRRAARMDILTQFAIFVGMGVIATVTVNVVLLRLVDRPLKNLLAVVEQISVGHLGARAPAFHTREMRQLASGINSMAHTLYEDDKARRLQMQKAREIQQHLLPNGVTLPHLQTAHAFEPADDVGGDYYDFLPVSDGTWLICLADVTGHGVPAAMGAAILKTLLVAESGSNPFELRAALKNINCRFANATLPGNFASMFLGRWNPKNLELTYACAGHEPAILLRASGRSEDLESTGLLIGIDTNADWELVTVQLSHEDRLLIFSDGATESQDKEGRLFGRSQLCQTLASMSDSSLSSAVTALCRKVAEHRGNDPAHDDLTLVLLACDESRVSMHSTVGDHCNVNRTADRFIVRSQVLDNCVTCG